VASVAPTMALRICSPSESVSGFLVMKRESMVDL
jgi:hypothetical protein